MQLFGLTIAWNGNGKYIKKAECEAKHSEFSSHLDKKLLELTIDRNQKLTELKSDIMEHMSIQMQMVRDLIKK